MARASAHNGANGSWLRIGAAVVAGVVIGGLMLRGGVIARLGTLALASGAYQRLLQSRLAEPALQFARRAKDLMP